MCEHANDPGGREAAMVIVSRDAEGVPTVWCDPCIAPLIEALNRGGVETEASCCGHGQHLGWVMLKNGRVLVIAPDLATAHALEVAALAQQPDAVAEALDEVERRIAVHMTGEPGTYAARLNAELVAIVRATATDERGQR